MHNDRSSSRRLISSTFFLLLGVSLAVGVVLCLGAWFAPLEWLLNTRSEIAGSDLRIAILLAICFAALLLPLRVADTTLHAQQRGYIGVFFAIGIQILNLLALVSMKLTGASLTGFTLAFMGTSWLGNAILFFWLFHTRQPDLKPNLKLLSRQAISQVGAPGLFFFLGTIGELVIMQTDYVVTSKFLGPREVPRYAVAYQLYNNLFPLVNVWVISLWPAWTEAAAKGEWKWVWGTYRRVAILSVGTMVGVGVVMGAFGQLVIKWWAGEEAVPPQALLWVMAVYFVVWAWGSLNGNLLNSLGAVRLRVVSTLCCAAINLGATLLLVRPFGVVGVSLGSLIGMALTDLWLFPLFLHVWMKKIRNGSPDTLVETVNA